MFLIFDDNFLIGQHFPQDQCRNFTFKCRPTNRWNRPSTVSPAQRSKRSRNFRLEERTRKSLSLSPCNPSSLLHTSHPQPRSEELLPSPLISHCRSSLISWSLGPSSLQIWTCCHKAESIEHYQQASLDLANASKLTVRIQLISKFSPCISLKGASFPL